MQDRAALARKLTEISADKRELLKKLLESKAAGASAIPRRKPGDAIPLTFSQQRLWIIDQLLQGRTAYNETNLIRLSFAVDIESFRRALDEIVRRHEIMRTTIHSGGDDVFQLVRPPFSVDFPVVDVRQVDPASREAEALRLASEEALVRMDLETGPLVRAVLYRLDTDDYLFALTLHHIVCDGWSMGVIAVELSTLYWSHVLQKPSPLPELGIQYGDFAVWQRKALGDEVLRPQLDYWRAQLAGLPNLDLPTDRPRPPQFTYRGARLPLRISGALLRSIMAIADRENVTPHIVLLTALMILLHKYTGQDDIAVGTPVAGRTRHELEPLVGFFVNTLVVRADVSGDPQVRECLARVRHVSFAAYTNQDVPFERLVEELHPVRDPSRNPLVQVVFQLYQPPAAPGLNPAMVFPFEPAPSGASKFDLHFQLILSSQEIRGFLEYNTDLFDARRIERLSEHLSVVLSRMVQDPGMRVSQLDILTTEERRLLLDGFNQTAAEYPHESDIVAVFAGQAMTQPDAVAVEFRGLRLTYAELQQRAASLADVLAARGIQEGDVVGLLMDRCLELPEAMLGILMSGAAYLPLDPNYPKDRLSYLLADSGAKIIVTTSSLRSVADSLDRPSVLADEPREEASIRAPAARPDNVAYLLYTSGTTGKPKGVPLTHRGAVRLVKGVTWVSIGAGDTCFHFAPITYDASVFEIWGALLNGSRLVICPPDTPLDELPSVVKRSGVTVLFLATSLLRYVVDHGLRELRQVRQLITGGEVIPADVARAVWKALPRTRIVNAYGPTECATIATAYTLRGGEEIEHLVPIGRPVENTKVYILDKYGHPAPIGVSGEIFIGGDAVAPGYWNRPELTRERFVPDPFSSTPGGTLYATGDIGRYRDDGNIDFLGRKDRQIKLSGYRIELDEVEAAVASHPEVSTAAALIAVDDGSAKRLAVFAERLPDAQITASELRSYVAARLPQYMVPSQVEVLDCLPVTPNGKVDLKQLTRRLSTEASDGGGMALPQSALERVVHRIWREILHTDSFGVTDDFFALGGQSLVATRLLSRVRASLEHTVSMRDFFDNPTVRGLSALLAQDDRASKRADLLLRIESLGATAETTANASNGGAL